MKIKMGENRRRNFPFPTSSLDPRAGVTELTRTNSNSSDSGFTVESFRDLTANARPGQTIVWTNEIHNSYLDFLEASFVKQLHYSMSLRGCHPQVGMWEHCPIPQRPVEGHNSSHQFSVLQDCCGQKINYQSNDPSLDSTADSGDILGSPWLMSAGKSSSTEFPVPRETLVPNDGIYLRSNTNLSCKSARSSEQNPIINSCNHSLCGCTTEVSDQNFLEEDLGEKTSYTSGAKRLKTMPVLDASSNSQVAPVGKLRTMDDSIIGNTSPKRGRKRLLSDHPESLTCPKSDIHCFPRES